MSTRSITILKDSWTDHKEIVVMYRQTDGYLDGHGKDLAEFLNGIVVVNGISLRETGERIANGGSCLAAQVVEHFKNLFGVGGIYLHSAGTRGCDEEYVYTVIPEVGKEIILQVDGGFESNMTRLFEGTPSRFLQALKDGEIKEEE